MGLDVIFYKERLDVIFHNFLIFHWNVHKYIPIETIYSSSSFEKIQISSYGKVTEKRGLSEIKQLKN